MVYRYKENTRIKAPAQVAGEMCEHLAQTGGLTPKRLVDANRAEDAPLHGEFEWDDAIAAENYREEQASYIIRHLTVVTEEKKEGPIRAFVRVTDSPRDYTPMNVVVKNADMMATLLLNAKKDMLAFVKKYKSLEQLNDVIQIMIESVEKIA